MSDKVACDICECERRTDAGEKHEDRPRCNDGELRRLPSHPAFHAVCYHMEGVSALGCDCGGTVR